MSGYNAHITDTTTGETRVLFMDLEWGDVVRRRKTGGGMTEQELAWYDEAIAASDRQGGERMHPSLVIELLAEVRRLRSIIENAREVLGYAEEA